MIRRELSAALVVIVISMTLGCQLGPIGPQGGASREKKAKVNLIDFDANLDGSTVVISFRITNGLLAPVDVAVGPRLEMKLADGTIKETHLPGGDKYVRYRGLPEGTSDLLEIRMDLGEVDPATLLKLVAHLQGDLVGEWEHTVISEGLADIQLGECFAYIEGRTAVIEGSIISGDEYYGQTSVAVTTYIRSGEERHERGPEMVVVAGGGGYFGFESRIPIPETWRLPEVDDFWAGVESIEGDWKDVLDLASLSEGAWAEVQRGPQVVIHYVLYNLNLRGYQIVEFEPYVEYELHNGSVGRLSEVIRARVNAGRRYIGSGLYETTPMDGTWSRTLPADVSELARLEVGMTSAGVDWQRQLIP